MDSFWCWHSAWWAAVRQKARVVAVATAVSEVMAVPLGAGEKAAMVEPAVGPALVVTAAVAAPVAMAAPVAWVGLAALVVTAVMEETAARVGLAAPAAWRVALLVKSNAMACVSTRSSARLFRFKHASSARVALSLRATVRSCPRPSLI